MDPLSTAIGVGANLIGGFLGRQSNEEQMEKNRQLQREFATSGIQWKVEDAKKAGIHPLYALGAPTMSPAIQTMQDPLGSAISSMGQDLSRAKFTTADPNVQDMSAAILKVRLEGADLDNQIKATQLAKLRGQVAPGVPSMSTPDGLTDANRVKEKPNEVTMGSLSNPGVAPGANPDVEWVRTVDGGWTIAPSKGLNERVQDMGAEPWLWSWRNRITPYVTGHKEPNFPPPSGGRWEFNHLNQTWYDAGTGPYQWQRRSSYRIPF